MQRSGHLSDKTNPVFDAITAKARRMILVDLFLEVFCDECRQCSPLDKGHRKIRNPIVEAGFQNRRYATMIQSCRHEGLTTKPKELRF
jgi:hypothetical protein